MWLVVIFNTATLDMALILGLEVAELKIYVAVVVDLDRFLLSCFVKSLQSFPVDGKNVRLRS